MSLTILFSSVARRIDQEIETELSANLFQLCEKIFNFFFTKLSWFYVSFVVNRLKGDEEAGVIRHPTAQAAFPTIQQEM